MSIIFRHAVKIFYWLPLEDRFMEFIYKYKGTIVRKKLKSCNHIFLFLFSYEFEHINTEETALIWLTLKTFTLQTQEQRSEVRHDWHVSLFREASARFWHFSHNTNQWVHQGWEWNLPHDHNTASSVIRRKRLRRGAEERRANLIKTDTKQTWPRQSIKYHSLRKQPNNWPAADHQPQTLVHGPTTDQLSQNYKLQDTWRTDPKSLLSTNIKLHTLGVNFVHSYLAYCVHYYSIIEKLS